MNQRGFAAVLILYAVAALAVLGALWGAWHKIDHWENAAVREARSERDLALSRLKECADARAADQKRASDLALLWSAQVDKTEQAARQRKEAHEATFAVLQDRARSVRAGGTVRFSPDAWRLFADASNQANATGAAPVSEAPPDSVPDAAEAPRYSNFDEGEFRTFVVTAAQAYADAVNQHRECVTFYEALRGQAQAVP